MKIGLTWVALPIAGVLSNKNPVIGLSGIGFILFNALTHIGAGVVLKMSFKDNAGVYTSIFLFIPILIWTMIVNKRKNILPKKGLGIAIINGMIRYIMHSWDM